MDVPGIIVLVLAVALVLFTVIYNVYRKKKGKTGCGCNDANGKGSVSKNCGGGCGNCPYKGDCGPSNKGK